MARPCYRPHIPASEAYAWLVRQLSSEFFQRRRFQTFKVPFAGRSLCKYELCNLKCGRELSLKVGDGGKREGGISWGCLTPPLLHQRSDMPCPKITSSS